MVTFSARKEKRLAVGVKGLNPRQINKRPFFILYNIGAFSFGVPNWQEGQAKLFKFSFRSQLSFKRILFTLVTSFLILVLLAKCVLNGPKKEKRPQKTCLQFLFCNDPRVGIFKLLTSLPPITYIIKCSRKSGDILMNILFTCR